VTPLERLLAEEVPTGTFGHATDSVRGAEPGGWWTPEEQAAHRAELEAALGITDSRSNGRPQLRLVDGEAA
jgi:hypothetical protein